MAYSGTPKIPEGFIHLADASNYPTPKTYDKYVFNTIGVCTDFLEYCKTRGTDYSMKLTLHDPYYPDFIGVSFQIFFDTPSMAPAIKNQGDVLVIHNAEKYNSPKLGVYYTGKKGQFSWAVIEHASLGEAKDNSEGVIVHRSERYQKKAPYPTAAVIEYARAILALEDPSRWQAPAPSTALQISATMAANGGTPNRLAGKHRIISEMQIPTNNRCYVDLTVEIRRMYQTDLRVEYSVTDYSENQNLYNHSPDSAGAYDPGDPYNYTNNNSSLANWTGPWGKRTMTVVLWEPHRTFALQNFSLGSFIALRNVHVKVDSIGAKLEGVIHGDNINPDKILVSRLSATDAEWHDSLKSLLQRKRDHEQYCKVSGLPFIRDADPAKLIKLQGLKRGRDDDSAALETNNADQHESARTKKNRRKKEKQRAKAAAKAGVPYPELNKDGNGHENVASLAPNAHVRTNETAASAIRIDEILDPQLLQRETLKGNQWQAPFQNARYKSRVVVVDYFPKRLEEFVVKVRKNQYAVLGGVDGEEEEEEAEEDVDVEADDDAEMREVSDAGEGPDKMDVDDGDGGDGARWEWRFMLVVQDPSALRRGVGHSKGQDQRPKQIELMVSGQDADYLLREEACDLRRNKKALARLREKMFVLWGDLQERVEEEEKRKADGAVNGVGGDEGQVDGRARSQPFECYIAEYGTKREGTAGDRVEDWKRCWRMVHTTVA